MGYRARERAAEARALEEAERKRRERKARKDGEEEEAQGELAFDGGEDGDQGTD